MIPAWEINPVTWHHTTDEKTVSLDGLTLQQMDNIVSKAALSNQDRHAAATARADAFAFQTANPWFRRTVSNTKVVNDWLRSKGIKYGTYPEFAEAAEELAQAGLISVDDAAWASHLDGLDPKGKFVGALTRREYGNLDEMIAQERAEAIAQLAADKPTDQEKAFERLPLEEQCQLLRNAVATHQVEADGEVSKQNADSWITLHPEYRDDARNAKMLLAQIKRNGVTGPISIEDYEIADRQLVAAGMIRQNPVALQKQAAQEVLDRAKRAVETPGSVWDQTTEDEAYVLPLDEVRRRASGNYSGR